MRRQRLDEYTRAATSAALAAALFTICAAPEVGAQASPPAAAATPTASQQAGAPACVALDTSGSLNDTDPDHYAVSVLSLVADLATRAVITVYTFSGEGPSGVTLVGTFDLTDGRQVETLHRKIAELSRAQRQGATPTAALIDAVYRQLVAQNAPAGAGCIIVSDGKPEPDTDGQYKAIAERLPAFAERGWRLHTVALGSGEWIPPFLGIASQLGGAALQANSADQLLRVGLNAWAAFRNESPPETRAVVIGPDGRASIPIELDPTIKQLTVLVTRPDPTVTAILSSPQPAEVKPSDGRLVGYNTDDRHYALYALSDTKTLGAGTWSLELRGPRGAHVQVAIARRSTLRLALTEPRGGMVLADRPSRICAQLLDGSQPLGAANSSVRLLAIDGDGRQRTADLRDDGRPDESGDARALDGMFCGRVALGPGAHHLRLEAATPGSGAAVAEGSLLADQIPGFQPLETRGAQPPLRDGERVSAPFAQLGFNGGRVDPALVKSLVLVVRPADGPARRIELDPATALDANGVLTVSYPVYVADAPERSGPGADGSVRVPYKLALEAGFLQRGQLVVDETAVTRATSVGVLPWPGPCGVLPTQGGTVGLRGVCTSVAESPLLRPVLYGAGAVLGLFVGLMLLVRLLARCGLGGGDYESGGGTPAQNGW